MAGSSFDSGVEASLCNPLNGREPCPHCYPVPQHPISNCRSSAAANFRFGRRWPRALLYWFFFKISCPVCQYSLPYFGRLAHALAGKGVSVIAISQDDEEDTARFLHTWGVAMPTARDNEHGYAVSAAYGLTNVPTAFEVGVDGKIAASIVGWSKAEVEEIYARHLDHERSGLPLFEPGEQVADFRPG